MIHVHVNGETISATLNHPFYVDKLGWTLAKNLRAGDILVLSNGEFVVVEWIQHEILENPIKVYNFSVQNFHTYFVGESSVLVHNDCPNNETLSITKNNEKHINKRHNANKYAEQLQYKSKEATLKELENTSFFNKDWSSEQIRESVNFGYNSAVKQGIENGTYTFEYFNETVTVALENGRLKTAYGDYIYSYDELLKLLTK